MKRVGHLMERVVQMDNLYEAFLKAKRGKSGKTEVIRFGMNLDSELDRMAAELMQGNYQFGDYFHFTVYDPKKRIISAAPFRDRVAMHAMMRISHPVFDDYQVFDSYASRLNKGTYKALERLMRYMRGGENWFVKLDVCHYFDSIHHDVLTQQLKSLFKDPLLLCFFDKLIRGYQSSPGRGLPIGNLTSQYFANHYLAVADHYLKEQLGAKKMVRYMDDIIIVGADKERLLQISRAYRDYVEKHLLLKMHEPVINHCRFGIPFLGYVAYPNGLRLNQRSRKRFVNKTSYLTSLYRENMISEGKYKERLMALYAFVRHAKTEAFNRKVVNKIGILP